MQIVQRHKGILRRLDADLECLLGVEAIGRGAHSDAQRRGVSETSNMVLIHAEALRSRVFPCFGCGQWPRCGLCVKSLEESFSKAFLILALSAWTLPPVFGEGSVGRGISLAGEWRLRLDPDDAGIAGQWFKNTSGFPDRIRG